MTNKSVSNQPPVFPDLKKSIQALTYVILFRGYPNLAPHATEACWSICLKIN